MVSMTRGATEGSEALKRAVAVEAVERYVRGGMRIGLGTGSTASYAVREVAKRQRAGTLEGVRCMATSVATAVLARRSGLEVERTSALLDGRRLDVVVDGADAVDGGANLIKGGGGALLQEKVAAYNSDTMVVVVDGGKLRGQFDECAPPVPVEVLPQACNAVRYVCVRDFRWGGAPIFARATIRALPDGSGAHYVTDNNNLIVDLWLAGTLGDVEGLEVALNGIPGVLENGLFARCSPEVLVGSVEGLFALSAGGLVALV